MPSPDIEALVEEHGDEIADYLERSGGVKLLGRMNGLKAVSQGMAEEQHQIEQDNRDYRRTLYGCEEEGQADEGDGGMRDLMSARDIHIHQSTGVQGKTTPPTNGGINPWLLAGAMLLGGGGLGFGLSQLFGGDDQDTITSIVPGFGPTGEP